MSDSTTDSAEKKKSPRKFIIIAVVLIAAGLFLRFVVFKGEFLYAGTLEATKVDLSAQVPSVIAAVNAHEGDHVTVNQELITLSCDDIKVAAQIANENYNRNLRLFKSGSASQEVLDQMKNRMDDVNVRLNWCDVKSPISGTVLSRYHEPGEWVSPGTKLMTLANIKDIWTYIYIPEPEVSMLKPGMKMIGVLPELGNREFEGHILKINSEAEFTPKNVQTQAERTRLVYGVKISFLGSNDEEILKPGMTLEVKMPNGNSGK